MMFLRVNIVLACWLLTVATCQGADATLVLRNPDMEAGLDVPEGWSGQFGKVRITRDTQIFHGGGASLKVQNNGVSTGSGHQMMPVTPGMKVKVGGWLKTAEGTKASFAAQFYDDKFAWTDCLLIKRVEGAQDWESGEKEFTIPEQASRMAIALYVEGIGQAWLDDVTLSGDGITVEIPKAEPEPTAPELPVDVKLIPTTPVRGFFANYPRGWNAYHEAHLKRAQEGGVDVLFLGDSLTQGWSDAGREAWEENFAPLKAANFGIGGDMTGNVLWRLDHDEVSGISPRVVVLMIGVNNLWSGKNTGEEIAAGTKAIVGKLREKLPQSKVLVLGVLPIGASEDEVGRLKAQEINVHTAALGDGGMVKYADPGAKLVQKNGRLLEGAYASDNLHLTSKGYEVLAKELLPQIVEMLK